HNWRFDMAVDSVKAVDGKAGKGTMVTLSNLRKMVLPAMLKVHYSDGSSRTIRIPVATWMRHKTYKLFVPGAKTVQSVVLDPQHSLPDDNRANNRWPAGND